jgi:hypothetical protein
VAILQISRITQRKGLEQDLPQPLAGAEFGWAVDQRKLYIGNGELAEGAPVVGNTEILTEFSDLLAYSTAYTYEGNAGGYVVQTGATSGSPVTQSLQNRLDSYAVVTNFGAVGDGVTDDTAAINRALFQIYCREVNPQIRRSLFFPAGVYLITGTLLIPPYALLYGEGSESSIIQFKVETFSGTVTVGNIAYQSGVLVYYPAGVGGNYYFRSLGEVPVGVSIDNPVYWDPETLPEFVIRTSDSLQQVGGSIGTNGGIAPRNVEVTNMSIQTFNVGDMGLVPPIPHSISLTENAEQITYQNVNFVGPLTTTDITASTDDLSCVRFASTGASPCTQIKFDNCKFSNAVYAFATDQVIKGVTVSNSYFDTLYQGVVLETDPTGVRFVQNTFDNIYAQGIVFDGTSLNATAYNTFYNVGNSILASAGYSVIDIDGNNNVSIGDMFERTTAQSATYPRINLTRTNSIALGMNIRGIAYTIDGVSNTTVANQMNLGNYQRTAGIDSILADNNAGTLFVVSTATIKAFRVDYTISRGTSFRTGSMLVVNGTVSGFTYSDDYVENTSTGVTLTATEASAGGNITVAYATTSTGTAGSITYSIAHLA